MTVGNSAGGNQLVISNGGFVGNSVGYVGLSPGGNNSVVVSGASSIWSNRSDLYVGFNADGNRLGIESGGQVVNAQGLLGVFGGSSNEVVVSGAGSLWSNRSDLYVGGFGAGNRLVVSNGGTVFGSNVFLGNTLLTNNRIVVDGGTLRATNVSGTAVLDVQNGTNILNAGSIEVDRLLLTNSAGRFELNGGTLSTRNSVVNNGQLFRVGNTVNPATFHLCGNGSHSFPDGLTVSAFATLLGNGAGGRFD